jgi:two-component system response regulator AtoC
VASEDGGEINMQLARNRQAILVVEDDPTCSRYLETALKYLGFGVEMTSEGNAAIRHLRSFPHDISAVLLDVGLPQRDGFSVLDAIKEVNPLLPVIMISGAASTMNAVAAFRHGASDFLGKPFSSEELRASLARALQSKPRAEKATGPSSNGSNDSPRVLGGLNPQMREIAAVISQISRSEAPVLIQGETGTGKEVLAREIHSRSQRAGKQFLKLNCAALPSELVESELFGYERGAFTGALQRKPGMFELADGGTILLDEIGDMDVRLQAKLLQVLQDHEFQRIGGKELVRVNVRVMAATHRDLERAIVDGSFREDLYYRLNVICFFLPPLRERREDVMLLAEALLKKHTAPSDRPEQLTPELKNTLTSYDWPGNIRELENVIRKLVILRNPEIVIRDLRDKIRRSGAGTRQSHVSGAKAEDSPILERVTKVKQQAEKQAIVDALNATHWNRKQAATLLQIDYKALLYKMKRLGVEDKVVPFTAASGTPS